MGNSSNNIQMLNKGIDLEYMAVAAYETAIGSGKLNNEVSSVARNIQSQHSDHANKLSEFVQQLGGQPAERQSTEEYAKRLPADKLTSQESILHLAAHLEKMATIGFLQQVAELEDRKMAQAISSISSDEAMHWAVLRSTLGENPIPVSFIPLNPNEVED